MAPRAPDGTALAKLGPYSYPDIRFGDAVEIAGRIQSKFKGTVNVKGLAWELGMAEGSGTLFAKVAALRDFGLVEGRGELHVSPLAQRVLHPASGAESRKARAEAFHRVELLRRLYHRFEGEVPDDASLLIGLEELTNAPRGEIVRRASLIQKHLGDAFRTLGRLDPSEKKSEYSTDVQRRTPFPLGQVSAENIESPRNGGLAKGNCLELVGGGLHLSVPLTSQYIDVAIQLLTTLKAQLPVGGELAPESAQRGGSSEDSALSAEDEAATDTSFAGSFGGGDS
jgi:hypothetical protein